MALSPDKAAVVLEKPLSEGGSQPCEGKREWGLLTEAHAVEGSVSAGFPDRSLTASMEP
jgi:hypothetical protein